MGRKAGGRRAAGEPRQAARALPDHAGIPLRTSPGGVNRLLARVASWPLCPPVTGGGGEGYTGQPGTSAAAAGLRCRHLGRSAGSPALAVGPAVDTIRRSPQVPALVRTPAPTCRGDRARLRARARQRGNSPGRPSASRPCQSGSCRPPSWPPASPGRSCRRTRRPRTGHSPKRSRKARRAGAWLSQKPRLAWPRRRCWRPVAALQPSSQPLAPSQLAAILVCLQALSVRARCSAAAGSVRVGRAARQQAKSPKEAARLAREGARGRHGSLRTARGRAIRGTRCPPEAQGRARPRRVGRPLPLRLARGARRSEPASERAGATCSSPTGVLFP